MTRPIKHPLEFGETMTHIYIDNVRYRGYIDGSDARAIGTSGRMRGLHKSLKTGNPVTFRDGRVGGPFPAVVTGLSLVRSSGLMWVNFTLRRVFLHE